MTQGVGAADTHPPRPIHCGVTPCPTPPTWVSRCWYLNAVCPPPPPHSHRIKTNMFYVVHFIFSSTVSHWLLSLNYNVYLASQHSFSTCRTHHWSTSLIPSTVLPTLIRHATGTSYFRRLSRRELCPLASAFCRSLSSVFLPPVSWVRFGRIDVVCVLSWNRR